jgi:hypothetical protein
MMLAALVASAMASCAGRSESYPSETGGSGNVGATGGTQSVGGSGGAPSSGGTGDGAGGAPALGGATSTAGAGGATSPGGTGGRGGTGGDASVAGAGGTAGAPAPRCFERPYIDERACGSVDDCTYIGIGVCCGYIPAVGVRRGYSCIDDGLSCATDCEGILGYVTDSGEETVSAGDIQVACRPGELGIGLCETYVRAYAD